MKTSLSIQSRSRRDQSGVAVLVMLVLISMILIYIAANIRSLNSLQKELQQTEQRQLQRWTKLYPPTIATALTNAPSALTNVSPSTPSSL
jgi:predicted PurR-regulated permease PerM